MERTENLMVLYGKNPAEDTSTEFFGSMLNVAKTFKEAHEQKVEAEEAEKKKAAREAKKAEMKE